MKNILILNLGHSKDILMSSYLISSYKEEHPQSQISILVYKENESLAKTLNGIHRIYTLDAQIIKNIIENPLYSDAFALNQFSEDISELSQIKWRSIINYANDNASAYLMKSFDAEEIRGSYIDVKGTAKTSDKWSNYQNYVMPKMKRYGIPAISVRNHITSTPMYAEAERIKIDPEYVFVANQNLNRVRQMNGDNSSHLVGINLEVGYDGCALSEETISDIIETFEDTTEFKAVLLSSGKSFQKEIINNLNKKFNNSLVSINVETVALSSVLSNIDLLISSATDQLIIADALNVKLIEIKNESDGFLNPTTVNDSNFVIYNKTNNLASDIILAVNEMFETHLPITAMQTVNPTYLSIHDDYGVYFTQVRGDIKLEDEIDYHIRRAVHYELMGYSRNEELVQHIKEHTDKNEIEEYCNKIKLELTETVKSLLATIRSLKTANASQSHLNNFISNLDALITRGSNDTTVASVVRFFEGSIENISSESAEENFKEIENNLFLLKSDIQIVSNILNELVSDNRINKSRENTAEIG